MGVHSFTNGNGSAGAPPSGSTPPAGPPPFPGNAAPNQPNGAPEMLVDYNARFGSSDPALFRDHLVQQMLAVLIRRQKPNPLLVGPAGVGKTRLVEDLARMIASGDPKLPTQLQASTVYELPLGALVSGAGVVGQLESRVLEMIDFLVDPAHDAVLFIDEVHLLADNHDPIYSKIAQLLKPAMARGDLRLIAATTAQEARKLDDDPAFARRFARLIVDELTPSQTETVLEGALPGLLKHYRFQVQVPTDLLAEVVAVSEEFKRADQHRPDSALTLLDQSMADLVVSRQAMMSQLAASNITLTPNTGLGSQVTLGREKLAVVARRIASGNAEPPAADRLSTIGDELKADLLGQDNAIDRIGSVLLRESLQLSQRNRPATWIFAGPSGVGKTAAADILARHLTGQDAITLNMAEYSLEHDQSKLLGAGPGYVGSTSNKELPFDSLESNPYRLILLDELEKAHPAIHRLFLSALDVGWLRMASGKVIDFSKAIVVATTNAGASELTKASIGFSPSGMCQFTRLSDKAVADALGRNGFAPEFLGRFEHIIAFDALALETYTAILRAELERLEANPSLQHRGLVAPVIDDDEIDVASRSSFNPALGARPAKRAARELLEDALLAANPLLAQP